MPSLAAATDLVEQLDLDALAVFNPRNLRYLTGFTGSDGALVVTATGACFLTDSRYVTQAADEVADLRVEEYAAKLEGVSNHLRAAGVVRVGFEAGYLSFAQVQKLEALAKGKLQWVPVDKPVQTLRARKTPEEAERLAAAADLAAGAFESVIETLRPGQVEAQFALELEIAMRRAGGEEKAFDMIVASGERGALPHGIASSRQVREGELVTIDFGVRYQGYCSDETVTLALGNIPSNLRRIFAIVLEAHDRAIEMVRPGMALVDLDACAREVISAAGYGDYFGHGLGHGVGLEVHEYPAISPRAEDTVEEGMVLTIEPGIYLPGEGGVRIEDMVYVTADGCRLLTRIDKRFRNLL